MRAMIQQATERKVMVATAGERVRLNRMEAVRLNAVQAERLKAEAKRLQRERSAAGRMQ